jgi:HEAT repeat protein
VPLGLVKREQKERPRLDRDLDPSADRGSELYQVETTPINHDDFLTAVHARQPGEHIVILGEPGAGKTTLLTRVWDSLLAQVNAETPMIVAWVPLAALKNQDLAEYLKNVWLKQICPKICPTPEEINTYWQSFEDLVAQQQVWLLLDGADEMGGDGLAKIQTIFQQRWTKSIRAIITCRLNLWDGSGQNELKQNFQIFHTLDFKYANSTGQDEVAAFIGKWFDDVETGKRLRSALDKVGKERIKDLAKNPLRLTLLCNIWQREQGLPDTQAGLYKRFVPYVYSWSKVQDAEEMQVELDRVMGILAKHGINKPSLRFRFTERELQEQVPDLVQRKVLKALGWLNCVGVDESDQEVYAFFHPTFQEYFAACSIDDWDYFLPRAHVDRPVPCLNENETTYRVFESEWRQPIMLWFGRGDVADADKEKFIEKLTTFQDGVGDFYYYRAYRIGAIGVGEFKDSQQAKAIVQQLVTWAFDYFNTDKQEWRTNRSLIESFAREIIPFTHHGYAITFLVTLLQDTQLPYNLRDNVAEVLGEIAIGNPVAITSLVIFLLHDLRSFMRSEVLSKIAIGNPEAITTLLTLLQNPQLNYLHKEVAKVLGEIAVGNPEAITTLLTLLQNTQSSNQMHYTVAEVLGEIAVGSPEAIAALLTLLQNPQLSDYLRIRVTEVLGKISVGNPVAITILVTLLQNPLLFDDLCYGVTEVLGKISVGNPVAIAALVALLQKPQLSDDLSYSVAKVLGEISVGNPVAISSLLTLLQNPQLSNYLHKKVAKVLGEISVGNPVAISSLLTLLQNPQLSDRMRKKVAKVLGKIAVGNPEAITALVKLLQTPQLSNYLRQLSNYLRKKVAKVLGEIAVGNPAAINSLLTLLPNPQLSDDLRCTVAEVLGEIAVGNPAAINFLLTLLQNSQLSNNLRCTVAEVLGEIAVGNPEAINFLLTLLQNPQLSDDLCCTVAEALGEISVGNPQMIAFLLTLLQNPQLSDDFFYSMGEFLCKISVGNPETIATLTKLLQNPQLSNQMHKEVAKVLGEISVGNPETIATLAKLLQNSQLSDNLFYSVAGVLSEIAVGSPIPELVELLYVKERKSRHGRMHYRLSDELCYGVVEALVNIAVGNPEAITVLIDILCNLDHSDFDTELYLLQSALNSILSEATMPSAIWQLKNSVTDEVYNSNFSVYCFRFRVLFRCAQNFSYPKFHNAWHQITFDSYTTSELT